MNALPESEQDTGSVSQTSAADSDLGNNRDAFTWLTLANALLRRRRILMVVTGVAVIGAATISLFTNRTYTARAQLILREAPSPVSQFATLAAQFGIGIGQPSAGGSQFYIELLASRELLREAVLTEYRVAAGRDLRDTVQATLVELYDVEGETVEDRIEAAISDLRSSLLAEDDRKSGMFVVEATADRPELAVQLNDRLIELLHRLNLEKRQSEAAPERQFVETRMELARRELERVEGELERFLDQNRQYELSPQLSFEVARLQRRVEFRQQLYTALAQAYEQARATEVRDTPVFTVFEHADLRTMSAGGPRPIRNGLFGLIVGGFLAVAIALVVDFGAREARANPEEYAHMRSLWQTTTAELRLPSVVARVRSSDGRGATQAEPSPGRGPGLSTPTPSRSSDHET